MANILIAGGTGLVGTRLSQLLLEKGHSVLHLSRKSNPQAKIPVYRWDLNKGEIEDEAIEKADYIINLAGAGIASALWTKARKKLIIDSRVKSNELLLSALSRLKKNPKAYLSASAVGYYGNTGDDLATEDSKPGVGFLTDSVLEWEKSIEPFLEKNIRTVVFRIGIVLSTRGGAFEKMFPSYKLYTGAYFGNGQQFYSWIHIDDLCRLFLMAIDQSDFSGVYNAVGPQPARLKTIAQSIADAMDKKALILPVPASLLRLTMGEMSEMLLFSTRVSSQKIEETGFEFQYPELEGAIRDVLKKKC